MSGLSHTRIEHGPAEDFQQEDFQELARRIYGENFREDAPDPESECLLLRRRETPLARCTLLAGRELNGVPGTNGLIGNYETLDDSAGIQVLTEACRRLAAKGVARVLGPMNGDTWRRYRLALASEPGDPLRDPAFFPGEPRNPFGYPGQFLAAGFEVAARYESRIDDELSNQAADAEQIQLVVESRGIKVRTLDMTRFLAELEALHVLSLEAFSRNLYYSPIDFATFRSLYEPAKNLIDPELILLAEDRNDELVSFLFTYADPTSIIDGRATRLIAKTVATAPSLRGLGLARHLFDLLANTARNKGYRTILHALAHEENASLKLSTRHGGRLFRRYALYQWIP